MKPLRILIPLTLALIWARLTINWPIAFSYFPAIFIAFVSWAFTNVFFDIYEEKKSKYDWLNEIDKRCQK